MMQVPADVLADLEVLGLAGAESATPLRGGRGGRTWQVRAAHGIYVLHRRTDSSAGRVLREQRSTALAHSVEVGPQPVAVDGERGLLLTRWIPGRAVAATHVDDPEMLERIATVLRQLHAAPLPRHRVRPTQDRARYVTALQRDGTAMNQWSEALAATREDLDALGALLDRSVPHLALVHGDVVPGNVIISSRRTSLVDFEYAGRGDPAFDLGNFAASAALDLGGIDALVKAYLPRAKAAERRTWQVRTRAWKRVAQGGWIAWVALGHELGPHAAHWRRWSDTAAMDLLDAHRGGELRTLLRRLRAIE